MLKTPFILLQIQLAPAPKFIILYKYLQSCHFNTTQCQEGFEKN